MNLRFFPCINAKLVVEEEGYYQWFQTFRGNFFLR